MRRRRNPDATWTGSEKQIEWARRIRAEAAPTIRGWIAKYRGQDDADHLGRATRFSRYRTRSASSYGFDEAARALEAALEITDARFWIDNRNCASVDHFRAAVEKFQGRRNPGADARISGSLLGIGTIHGLDVEVGGRVKKIATPGMWLAWEPRARRFHICKPKAQRAGAAGLSPAIKAAHKKFHSEAASKALVADVPSPKGKLKALGLLKALVYRVPSRMVLSPEKNPYAWHHAFGDTGHKGGAGYPDRVKPQLCQDEAGNLFICRRKGNIFTVDTWLRG